MGRRRHKWQVIRDHFGDTYDVAEWRDTPWGWEIALGWPHPHERGGMKTIMTTELHDFLAGNRQDYALLRQLPIGAGALKRLRKSLGHNRYRDNLQWWIDRLEDLGTMTAVAFCRAHQYAPGRPGPLAAAIAYRDFFGRKNRPPGWWQDKEVAGDFLRLPTAIAAEKYDIPYGSAGRIKSLLRRPEVEGLHPRFAPSATAAKDRRIISRRKSGQQSFP